MKQRLLLLLIVWMGYNTQSYGQTSVLQTEANGFQWYKKTIDHGYRGRETTATTVDGKILFSGSSWYDIKFMVADKSDEGVFVAEKVMGGGWTRCGIYKPNGQCVLSPENGFVRIHERFCIDGEYYFHVENVVNSRGLNGLCNSNGKIIIPLQYYKIEKVDNTNNRLFIAHHESNNCYREVMYDNTGTIICEGDVGSKITIENDLIKFTKSGCVGIYNINGKKIVPLNKGYKQVKFLDGLEKPKLFKVSKNRYSGPYGLIDSNGGTIIEIDYDDIDYIGGNYLKFLLNGFWGVMSFDGKVIIPTTRGYTGIGRYIKSQKRITYSMTGYKGECDATGRQISKIKVETPKQNTSVASSSNSSSSSKSKSENNSGNKTTTIVVEQHGPVQVWVACGGCQFEPGKCTYCHGSGWGYNGRLCSRCGGNGKCTICNGTGGHYEIQYK